MALFALSVDVNALSFNVLDRDDRELIAAVSMNAAVYIASVKPKCGVRNPLAASRSALQPPTLVGECGLHNRKFFL